MPNLCNFCIILSVLILKKLLRTIVFLSHQIRKTTVLDRFVDEKIDNGIFPIAFHSLDQGILSVTSQSHGPIPFQIAKRKNTTSLESMTIIPVYFIMHIYFL